MERTRASLKAFFETGDKPTEAQFSDLIDSLFNLVDDNGVKIRTLLQALSGSSRLNKSAILGADKALNRRGAGDVDDQVYRNNSIINVLPGDFWVVERESVPDGSELNNGDWIVALVADPGYDYSLTSQWMIVSFGASSPTSGSTLWERGQDAGGDPAGAQYAPGSALAKGLHSIATGLDTIANARYSSARGVDSETEANANNSESFGKGAKSRMAGESAHASDYHTNVGDLQTTRMMLHNDTTDDTETELKYPQTYPFKPDYTMQAIIRVTGRDEDNGYSRSWALLVQIRTNSVGTMNGMERTIIQEFGDTQTDSWSMRIVGDHMADGTQPPPAYQASNTLKIMVTGAAATNIRWLAHIDAMEITT